ncbi:hypothetical protein [Luteibacter yeojuensis]|uniref:Uncharacterized protein n=1 Tax=Luteibacter yeojuensis TaxID=345309 RepID=A0A0F3KGS9_9GAMM|nr:hypothetical protein [Luteibacter yeojuensis]KJV30423.1 hypothetical protein VI08_15045 [Luteibacter yeojuensis]
MQSNAPRIARIENGERVTFDKAPTIPAARGDGKTLPIDALNTDLEILAPVVDTPGLETQPGHMFMLIFENQLLESTAVTVRDPVGQYVQLLLPKATIQSLGDGPYRIAYESRRPLGATMRSRHTFMVIDRVAPVGPSLPRIILPEEVDFHGLTMAYLDRQPNKALRCVVPMHPSAAVGDRIHVRVRHRSSAREIEATSFEVRSVESDAVLEIPAAKLVALKGNGILDFYYSVSDLAGNASQPSRITSARALLVDIPIDIPKPHVNSATPGIVLHGDVRPTMLVDIPQTSPPCAEGDLIGLHLGSRAIAPVEVLPGDLANAGTMLSIAVPYNLVWNLVSASEPGEQTVSCRYDVIRDDMRLSSQGETIRFNLDTPGGRDPDPSTEVHERLALPVLRGGARGIDNVITLVDREHDGVASIPQADHPDGLKPGDSIQVFIGQAAVGLPSIIEDEVYPHTVAIPSAALENLPATADVRYRVTRDLGDSVGVVNVTSRVQRIRCHQPSELPGGGTTLADCDALGASENFAEYGVYGIEGDKLLRDHGIIVRMDAWQNIAIGDEVRLEFKSFDGFDEGPHVPSASGMINTTISAENLESRSNPAGGREETQYLDVLIPASQVDGLKFGRIFLSYAVTNAIGIGKSSPRKMVVDFRTTPRP